MPEFNDLDFRVNLSDYIDNDKRKAVVYTEHDNGVELIIEEQLEPMDLSGVTGVELAIGGSTFTSTDHFEHILWGDQLPLDSRATKGLLFINLGRLGVSADDYLVDFKIILDGKHLLVTNYHKLKLSLLSSPFG